METVPTLLDQVKKSKGIPSDYQLAKYLGVVTGSVQHWRHGRALPDESACEKIAEALGMDADVLIAEMNARRTKSPATRATWNRIAARLQAGGSSVAMMAVLAVVSATTTFTPNAHATALLPPGQHVLYYVNNALTRLFRALRRAAKAGHLWFGAVPHLSFCNVGRPSSS